MKWGKGSCLFPSLNQEKTENPMNGTSDGNPLQKGKSKGHGERIVAGGTDPVAESHEQIPIAD